MNHQSRIEPSLRALVAGVDDTAVAAALTDGTRDALLVAILTSPPLGRRRDVLRARLRRPAVLAGCVAAAAATTAFAVAVLRSAAPRDITATECRFEANVDSVISANSGDPVADCVAEWRRTHAGPPPALRAYTKSGMAVLVLPDGAPVPAGFAPVSPDFSQNTALIELDESLGDQLAGLASGCFTAAAAQTKAHAELARLGVAGWTVSAPTPASAGKCVGYAGADPAGHTVLLAHMPDPVPSPGSTDAQLVSALRRVSATCRSLPAAADAVREAAAALGVTEANHQMTLSTAIGGEGGCARVYLDPGGSFLVTVRGPAATAAPTD